MTNPPQTPCTSAPMQDGTTRRHDFTVVVEWRTETSDDPHRTAQTVMCRWCRRVDKVLWRVYPEADTSGRLPGEPNYGEPR